MLTLLPGGRILVAVEPVDGRKGIDSLAGVVRSVLKGDPMSGDLFVFRTRTRPWFQFTGQARGRWVETKLETFYFRHYVRGTGVGLNG